MGSPALLAVQQKIIDHFDGLGEAERDWVDDEGGDGRWTWTVRQQVVTFDTVHGVRTAKNLVAFWSNDTVGSSSLWWHRSKPSGRPTEGAGVTVLAAHVDSKYYSDMDFYGAHDAGASVGLLLHLATAVARWPRARSPLVFAFLDGEEAIERWTATDSLYGARALAAAWGGEPPFAQVVGDAWSQDVPAFSVLPEVSRFVLLDLLGDADLHLVPTFHNTVGDFALLSAAERLFLPLLPTATQPPPIFDSDSFINGHRLIDDHVPFLQRGVPVLHLMPYPFPSTWHTERDTFDELDGARARVAVRRRRAAGVADGPTDEDVGRFTLERVAASLEVALLEWTGISTVADIVAQGTAHHEEL